MILLAVATAGPFGFSQGEAPIDSPWKPASACEDCHRDEADDWSTSRHRVSHSNRLYQAGLNDEPSAFCVNCHSPQRDQAQEVTTNLRAYAWNNPLHRRGRQPSLHEEPKANQGVNCAVCHVRNGTILGPGDGTGAAHPVQQASMGDVSFCEGCHEFKMPEFSDDGWVLTDVPMQSTVTEWRAWGGQESCVSCHMPGGRHLFRGAHDRAFLANALSVQVTPLGEGVRITLQSVGVGHSFPTGDLFRNLTLEVLDRDTWTVLYRMGRTFEIVLDPKTARSHKTLLADTSLQPDEPMHVDITHGDRWRVRYHYGSALDERRAQLDEHTLYAVLAEGSLEQPVSAEQDPDLPGFGRASR